MDTGSGHIYDLNKQEVRDIKGKLVEWKVGEKVEVKDCLFEVVEIRCCPEDKIVLKGLAKELGELKTLFDKIPKHSLEENEKIGRDALRGFLEKK